jgi:glyoxylase-like metal-dependent hydrolase (beta-lactamase superfamily II)
MTIKAFCFNPFYENTYILYEGGGEAWIFDPGCSNKSEEAHILDFISENKLTLSRLLLTHAHIDHILGLDFVYKYFHLTPEMHESERIILESAVQISTMYGIQYNHQPKINSYIIDNQIIKYNKLEINCLWTPGHSPGSISYYIKDLGILIGGDVLFEGSIGRTDLPGGDYDLLIHSIKTRLFPLNDDTEIYPGHGGTTSIGQEKLTNPFLT